MFLVASEILYDSVDKEDRDSHEDIVFNYLLQKESIDASKLLVITRPGLNVFTEVRKDEIL